MSNEEFERRMEFILEQQAKFEANLQKQQERDAAVDARFDKVNRQIEQLVASLSILRDAIIGLTHHVEGHEDHLERHNQEMAAIRRANAERVELGKEMDIRLNALMLVVERHISGHQ
jgi:chromosome segregation ATPase